ncbi:TetR/AcrR family transcriptional regulator [Streptomyces sp. B21-083]|uniref:TetR/AcrR family transcriptional regulator n=1 Tax=Streptomyces sp. B21-083 TaxID=3039410 RepID=UPI002FF1C9A5
MKRTRMRRDQRLNNAKLIQAAAQLFERCEQPISLADIARQADVSVATAYRHFESADDALSAYRRDIVSKFRDHSLEQPSNGLALLESVCGFWVDLILAEGAALVHRRSSEGFLARYEAQEPYLEGQAEALARPIRELVVILGVNELAGVEDEAAFLWNVLFDPREIFDLRDTLALSPAQITHRLVSAFRGALLGWATARLTEPV